VYTLKLRPVPYLIAVLPCRLWVAVNFFNFGKPLVNRLVIIEFELLVLTSFMNLSKSMEAHEPHKFPGDGITTGYPVYACNESALIVCQSTSGCGRHARYFLRFFARQNIWLARFNDYYEL